MGLFDFFKSGGVLGQMAEIVGKLYLKISREEGSEVKKLVVLIVSRFLMSPNSDRREKTIYALERLRVMNSQGAIGVLAVCYTIASIEMDIEGIEDYVIKTIRKNLEKLGLSESQMLGRKFSNEDFDSVVAEFQLQG